MTASLPPTPLKAVSVSARAGDPSARTVNPSPLSPRSPLPSPPTCSGSPQSLTHALTTLPASSTPPCASPLLSLSSTREAFPDGSLTPDSLTSFSDPPSPPPAAPPCQLGSTTVDSCPAMLPASPAVQSIVKSNPGTPAAVGCLFSREPISPAFLPEPPVALCFPLSASIARDGRWRGRWESARGGGKREATGNRLRAPDGAERSKSADCLTSVSGCPGGDGGIADGWAYKARRKSLDDSAFLDDRDGATDGCPARGAEGSVSRNVRTGPGTAAKHPQDTAPGTRSVAVRAVPHSQAARASQAGAWLPQVLLLRAGRSSSWTEGRRGSEGGVREGWRRGGTSRVADESMAHAMFQRSQDSPEQQQQQQQHAALMVSPPPTLLSCSNVCSVWVYSRRAAFIHQSAENCAQDKLPRQTPESRPVREPPLPIFLKKDSCAWIFPKRDSALRSPHQFVCK